MKKNGVFLFVISHLVPEILKIFVLCKLGTDDVERCENISGRNDANELEFGKHVVHYMTHDVYFHVALATFLLAVSFCCESNPACLTV